MAEALRLDDNERGYLLDIAQARASRITRRDPVLEGRTRPGIHQALEVLDGVTPAFVLNHRQDVLAASSLAKSLLTDFQAMPYRERNHARWVLLDPGARELYAQWDDTASVVLANDARLATARHPDDSRLNELIGKACVKVPEFHQKWSAHSVDQCADGTQHFLHPVVG
ncbi:MmyB family transcriptional regulator [Streptomyces griseoluteus]|uniref:MmyB family transcriptional regulator n=1 Tax=Streptomyces griseoluteus TaxID=29306 RepID=UPI003803189F